MDIWAIDELSAGTVRGSLPTLPDTALGRNWAEHMRLWLGTEHPVLQQLCVRRRCNLFAERHPTVQNISARKHSGFALHGSLDQALIREPLTLVYGLDFTSTDRMKRHPETKAHGSLEGQSQYWRQKPGRLEERARTGIGFHSTLAHSCARQGNNLVK